MKRHRTPLKRVPALVNLMGLSGDLESISSLRVESRVDVTQHALADEGGL
jgi:hypothetical protein